MADVFTKKKRSEIMAAIRGKNTLLETDFLKLLSASIYPKGYRYRKHYSLPGKPDIAFIKQKIAIFIDGNFWHGYQFHKQKKRLPKAYWVKKIANNIKRDRSINLKLRKTGWTVMRFWEAEIKKEPLKIIAKIESKLKSK